MKKRVWVVGLILALAMGLMACGGKPTASDQVKKDLDEFKSEDIEEEFEDVFGDNKELEEKYHDEYLKFVKKIQDLDYEITDEDVKDDKATVTVKITTYDFGKAYQKTYEKVIADASSGAITAESDIESYVYETMFKNLNAVKDKDYTKEVKISCVKEDDGEWNTSIYDNKEVQDALMGGMISAAMSVG